MAKLSADSTEFYTVGWLDALRRPGKWRLRELRREWRYCVRQAKAGNWRAVRMTFNGWMYEPTPWPEGARRVGTGWTKRRAVRSFYRKFQASRA